VPESPGTFSDPLTIDNPYSPVVPGAVKVYEGHEEDARITVVDLHLAATRDFVVDGATVRCRAMQETEFEDGELVEISVNWFAQSDDGTVWYFGETVDDYEDGEVVGHGGSWLVGGPAAGDPVETMTVAEPAVFMPGTPQKGDVFRPEDLPDGSVEVGTVRRLGRRVRTPAGRFRGCVEVGELHLPDRERETKWYAPGVGVVLARARGERLALVASTLAGR
jgi:hypothetical protein